MKVIKRILSLLIATLMLTQAVYAEGNFTGINDGGGESSATGSGSLNDARQGYRITVVDYGGNRVSRSIDILKSDNKLQNAKNGRMYTGVKGDRGKIGESKLEGHHYTTNGDYNQYWEYRVWNEIQDVASVIKSTVGESGSKFDSIWPYKFVGSTIVGQGDNFKAI